MLATGEICGGEPIHEKQHPHDLFMEAAVEYTRPIGGSLGLQVYGGPVGEPALGPAAFPHRLSAMSNPIAPIAHHWLDATHVAFGVATAGVFSRRWKVEASAFNGREPDEDRRDLDLGPLDSLSGRVWFMPSERWALQASAGHVVEAEPAHEGRGRTDQDLVTASATYHRPVGVSNAPNPGTLNPEPGTPNPELNVNTNPGTVNLEPRTSLWSSTIAWGRKSEAGVATSFVLAEASVSLGDRQTWFARGEAGEKTPHEVSIHGTTDSLPMGKLQGGYVRHLDARHEWRPGIGGTVSASIVTDTIALRYGSRVTWGGGLFFVLQPARMR